MPGGAPSHRRSIACGEYRSIVGWDLGPRTLSDGRDGRLPSAGMPHEHVCAAIDNGRARVDQCAIMPSELARDDVLEKRITIGTDERLGHHGRFGERS